MSNVLVNPKCIPVIIAILFSLAVTLSSSGQCTATSTVNPARVVDSTNPGGSFSFNNPSNAILSDNIRASAAGLLSLFDGETNYLKASHFGFSIPLSAIICGIQVEVEKSATGIGNVLLLESYITDLTVKLVKNGTIVGNNKAIGTHWTNSDTYSSYGSNGDNWGASLVPADINSPEFGIVFAADLHGLVSLIPNAQIDNIRVTIYYLDALLPLTAPPTNARNNKNLLIKAFPNPFSEYILISGIKPGNAITLFDEYGRKIPSQGTSVNNNTLRLDMSHVNPGIYFVRTGNAITKIQKL